MGLQEAVSPRRTSTTGRHVAGEANAVAIDIQLIAIGGIGTVVLAVGNAVKYKKY